MNACWIILLQAVPAMADAEGDALARKVAGAAGDPYALTSLDFTVVVTAGEEEKARRSHSWQPQAGTLTVAMGGSSTRFESLNTTDPTSHVGSPGAHADTWSQVSPGTDPERAAKAWSAFINDSYWLLAASKVLDPGVNRSIDEEGRLVLTFDGVGLTPGDRYMLTVAPDSARVTAWAFELQNGREGQYSWTEHQTAGPLTLSTHRANEAGDFVVRFEDIVANP